MKTKKEKKIDPEINPDVDDEVDDEVDEDEKEKKINGILEKKIDRIVKAIKESPVRTEIVNESVNNVDKEKSIIETDPFLRRSRPFISLSDKMEEFVDGVRTLAKGGIVKTKALQESDDTAGGFFVPDEFRAEVIRYATETAIVRSRARILPMKTNVLTLPKLDQSNYRFAGIDIHWEGDEGELKEESQPKFGRITLKLGKMIGLCPISDDLLSDSAINLANFLVSIFGEAIAYEEDKQFLTGNGMKKPLGIINCATPIERVEEGKIKKINFNSYLS